MRLLERPRSALLAAAALLFLALATPIWSATPRSFREAKRSAAERHLPVLLDFSSEW